MLEHWKLQRDRNEVSCYANESLETVRNVSFRSLVEGRRQGKAVVRFESKVFFFFFQFSIRFSFHPSSLQSRRMNVCTRDVRNYEGLRVHFLWIYEKF